MTSIPPAPRPRGHQGHQGRGERPEGEKEYYKMIDSKYDIVIVMMNTQEL